MIPGLGGMNPRQMQKMMAQMGIKNEEIEALRVVIEKADGSKTVIEPASVTAIEMGGQKSFQISGTVKEEAGAPAGSGDAEMVAEQTGATREEAEAALRETGGDLAEAIMKLKK